MVIKRLVIIFLTVGLLFTIATIVLAAGPCDKDARSLCKGVKAGGGRIAKCLASQASQLCVECKELLSENGYLQSAISESSSAATFVNEQNLTIPEEYRQTYSNLKNILVDLDIRLASQEKNEKNPIIFAAELLPANCNRGAVLLQPQTIKGVILWLDRFKELGIQGVTFPIHYPLYTPEFPDYDGYVAFYKQVAQEVRKRGMKLDIESHIIFANTNFSSITYNYKALNFMKFKEGAKKMMINIINDLQPDYLNIVAEPDTAATLTGIKEFNNPQKITEYVNYILDGLNKGKTKIIAGVGSWGNIEHARSIAANTNVDALALHVYPINGKCIENIFLISDIARRYHKGVVLDEAWLNKADKHLGNGNLAWVETFRRDVYSFWAPLDQHFLASLVRLAQIEGFEYISPFWARQFFAYIDYNSNNANLSYEQLINLQAKAAVENMLADKFSSTGEFYKKLIQDNQNTVLEAQPVTLIDREVVKNE